MPKIYSFDDILYLMRRLRDPVDGCPWDLQQSYRDIIPHTIEECYELADAIAHGDMAHTEEELGDVLFQVVFLAQLGSEDGHFDFDSIVKVLIEKLVRRHPHVFPDGDLQARFGFQPKQTPAIKAAWEQIKTQERASKQQHGVLDDVPLALPALSRAQKLQKRAAGVGMDWPEVSAVLEKLHEELAELEQAIAQDDRDNIKEELGDIMFTAVNLSRHLKFDAEDVLTLANTKFAKRIRTMEAIAAARLRRLDELDETELDALWQAAKS